jgi:hypothetical protein
MSHKNCLALNCRLCGSKRGTPPSAEKNAMSFEDSLRLALDSLSPSHDNARATRSDVEIDVKPRRQLTFGADDIEFYDEERPVLTTAIVRSTPGRFAIRAPSLFDSDEDADDDVGSSVSSTSVTQNKVVTPNNRERSASGATSPSTSSPALVFVDGTSPNRVEVSSLAAREVEATGDFPTARAEFQLNPHGSFLDTANVATSFARNRRSLDKSSNLDKSLTSSNGASGSSTKQAAPKSPAADRVEASPARESLRDVDDAALLLHELERARNEQRMVMWSCVDACA